MVSNLKKRLESEYPKVEPRYRFSSEFQIRPKQKKVIEHPVENMGLIGYFFSSEDKLSVAQFRKDGFTYNRLKPYTSWNDVFSKTKQLWEIYLEVLSPQVVTRVAVRYINNMRFQLPVQNIEEHFNIKLSIPKGVPQIFSSFLNKTVVFDDQKNIEAAITFVMEPSKDKTHGIVTLDIDVYKNDRFPPHDLEQLWDIFNDLHDMKNHIFFGYITEETTKEYI